MNRSNYILQENPNGKGLVIIEGSEIGDCLTTSDTHAIAWYDCCGSLGKYLNDRATGVIENYHRNGVLKSKVLYEDGKQISYLNSWSKTGVLNFEIIPENDVRKKAKEKLINQLSEHKREILTEKIDYSKYKTVKKKK